MNRKQIEKSLRDEYVNLFKKNPNPTDNLKKILYERLLEKSKRSEAKDYEFFFQGNIELIKGNIEKAKECFIQSIKENDKNPFPYNSLGIINFRNNNIKKAIEYYKIALRHDNSIYFILYNLGRAFEKVNEIEKAKKYYKEVLNLDEDNQDAINGLQAIEDIYNEREKYHITKFETIDGFYIFADIRGFTNWSKNNILEIEKLFNIFYPLATKYFGEKETDQKIPFRRIVKFLGDGFFAIEEYLDANQITKKIYEIINNIIEFRKAFVKELNNKKIPKRDNLNFGFGITYSSAQRFKIKSGFDWTGNKVNYAARFCSVADKNEIILEEDFQDILTTSANPIKKDIKNYGRIPVLSIKI